MVKNQNKCVTIGAQIIAVAHVADVYTVIKGIQEIN